MLGEYILLVNNLIEGIKCDLNNFFFLMILTENFCN